MKRLLVLAAVGALLGACAPASNTPVRITVLGATSDLHGHINAAFEEWGKRSGISAHYETSGDFENLAKTRVTGDKPDLLLFPQPGLLAEFARAGHLRPLEVDEAVGRLQDGLADLGVVDGTRYGLPLSVNVKSLVWYAKKEFDGAGLSVPRTWDELVALTDRIRTEQKSAPWCVGIQDGGATGWVATDWIEDIVLSERGPDFYDAWASGKVPFSSPEVRSAFEKFDRLVFSAGHTAGGRQGALTTTFPKASDAMFTSPPGCWMHKLGSFLIGSLPDNARFGVDYDVFPFPGNGAVSGGGDSIALVSDRPEARKVLQYMTSAEWFKHSRAHEGGALSAFTDVAPSDYPIPADAAVARILNDASTFRFDASDRMPGGVGTGVLWKELTAWIEGQSLDITLKHVDAARGS